VTPNECLQKLEKMQLKDAINYALDLRSDDFGHDCTALLEAESYALEYIGIKSLVLITELERKLGIAENCLALIKKNTRGFDWPPENNWRSDLIIQLGAWAEKALSEIDAEKEGE
jgi:hypothetical protein